MKPEKYPVRLLRAAEEDLGEIASFLEAENPAAVEPFLVRMEKLFDRLSAHPFLGRVPNDEELIRVRYRFVAVQRYLVFYTVEGNIVLIHRIIHGTRDYLNLLTS